MNWRKQCYVVQTCVPPVVLSVDHPAHALLQMLANTATLAVSISCVSVYCLCVCGWLKGHRSPASVLPQQLLQTDICKPCSQSGIWSMLLSSLPLSVLCAPVPPAMHDQSNSSTLCISCGNQALSLVPDVNTHKQGLCRICALSQHSCVGLWFQVLIRSCMLLQTCAALV